LKKETKNFYQWDPKLDSGASARLRAALVKVFWFFFSKKNFLPLLHEGVIFRLFDTVFLTGRP